METKSETAATLNHLVEIHNDRVEGYDHASKETNEGDLKTLFAKHSATSRKFKDELSAQVKLAGGDPVKDQSIPGKVHQAWMDVKAALSTNDRKAVLKSCEFGEDVAVKAYEKAMQDTKSLSAEQQQMVSRQYQAVKDEHDTIRNLRDTAVAASQKG